MRRTSFIALSSSSGFLAFIFFRWLTGPTSSMLNKLLCVAFTVTGLLSACLLALLWKYISSCWVRISTIPAYIACFLLLSAFGVFCSSRLSFNFRSMDSDGFLYSDTSAMQMLKLDGSLFHYVWAATSVPLLLMTILIAIAARAGFRKVSSERHDVVRKNVIPVPKPGTEHKPDISP